MDGGFRGGQRSRGFEVLIKHFSPSTVYALAYFVLALRIVTLSEIATTFLKNNQIPTLFSGQK